MKTRLPDLESIDQTAKATAAGLSQSAAAVAYELFRDREFRRMAGLEQLSQTEQDRIFNELVVGFLVLIMLLLEAPDLRLSSERRSSLADLNKQIAEAHVEHLKTLGVQSDHLSDWAKLISMRYEEYARDKHEVRGAAMRIESAKKSLDLDGLSKSSFSYRCKLLRSAVTTTSVAATPTGRMSCSIGSLNHSPSSTSNFECENSEGGKITAFTRERVALKRMLHRLP